ncbi:acyl-CoA thioesterase [Primorskyibacter sp. S187A]|uniref:acyl-CoA thioesterase n=1 Tax=Primorskyibacter sp. S187A TaxID=3415130 RepID=UPI003C79B574
MPLQTRWADNDAYGHLNNATYLSLFDTALTHWQTESGLLAAHTRFLVVANNCEYHAELAFPDALTCGLACEHIGRTSFRLILGLFKGAEDQAATTASFTQVAVDPETHEKRALDDRERALLVGIVPASGMPQGL